MLRCIEQKACNISFMHPNQKIKINDCYMKINPPMWIAADFELMNIPFIDNDNDNVTKKFSDSYRFLDASLDNLSTTLKSFPSLDAIGMKDDLFKRIFAYPYDKG